MDNAIGQTIRALRQEKGWTLDDLSEKLDLSPSAISKMERGGRRVRLVKKPAIARAFGMTVAAFESRVQRQAESEGGRPLLVHNRLLDQVIDYRDSSLPSEPREFACFGKSRDAHTFALEAVDDSMAPLIQKGDLVFFDPIEKDNISNGALVFATFEQGSRHGCGAIARWFRVDDDKIMLVSVQNAAEPTSRSIAMVSSVAVATGVFRRIP